MRPPPFTTNPGFFVARISGKSGAGDSALYAWSEVWWSSAAGGAWQTKAGGRYATLTENPGVPLPGQTFAVGDYCLVRGGEGAGGTRWECVKLPDPAGTSGVDGSCAGCGWLAGCSTSDCLLVSIDGTASSLYLSTSDALTWTSPQNVTICGVEYAVTVARNAGGVPQLTLSTGGSGATVYNGQWNCCGCKYAKWDFNRKTLCPSYTPAGDQCAADVVELRVDLAACLVAGTSCATAPTLAVGSLYYYEAPFVQPSPYFCFPVSPGSYTIHWCDLHQSGAPLGNINYFAMSGPCNGGTVVGSSGTIPPSGVACTQDTMASAPITVPAGADHLCVQFGLAAGDGVTTHAFFFELTTP